MVAPPLVESSGAIFLYIPAHADSGGNRIRHIPHAFTLHAAHFHIAYRTPTHHIPLSPPLRTTHNFITCHTHLRNGPNRAAKWAVLQREMGRIALQFGPFRKILYSNVLHSRINNARAYAHQAIGNKHIKHTLMRIRHSQTRVEHSTIHASSTCGSMCRGPV